MSKQRDVSRIVAAANALCALTLDDLMMINQEAASVIASATRVLAAIPVNDWKREVHPEVREHARNNRKINAIKLQRELTNMSLVEAKDFVEAIQ